MEYIDQDGIIWDPDYARCPECFNVTEFNNRARGSGYFRCSHCGFVYDEPLFVNPEAAFIGEV